MITVACYTCVVLSYAHGHKYQTSIQKQSKEVKHYSTRRLPLIHFEPKKNFVTRVKTYRIINSKHKSVYC
jgi:hypothetical protein